MEQIIKKRLNTLLLEYESQKDFADKIGLPRQTLGNYLNGKRIPTPDILYKICDACNVSADWILGLSETKTRDTNIQSACETTGLSEETISSLSDLCHMKNIHDERHGKGYYSDLLKTIDVLVKNQDFLATLSGYFFNDFSNLTIINTKTAENVTLTNNGTFTIEDNANRFRLRIMDMVKRVREKVMEESRNGKS